MIVVESIPKACATPHASLPAPQGSDSANQGTVNADLAGKVLIIQPGGTDFTNTDAGFTEAINGGILELYGNSTFAGGSFRALEAASTPAKPAVSCSASVGSSRACAAPATTMTTPKWRASGRR